MDSLKATRLEHIGPKGWLRYVFPFQLPDDYDIDEVAGVLRAGFEAAKLRLPVMGCEAVPDTDAKQSGVLKLKQIRDGEIEAITVKDLRPEGAFPMTFSQLKSKSFPVAAFEATNVCRRSVWPVAGDRLPVSLVQVNFIQGGMILAWNLFHMFGDSLTYFIWSQVWAEECRRAQGLDIHDPVDLDDRMFTDRAQLMQPSGKSSGLQEKHSEYLVLPFTPQGAPPKMTSNTHRGLVFYFSPEALEALKAQASPSNATSQRDHYTPDWISTNDAISALLWRTVMAVQNPIESLGDADPISAFAIAIDGRSRTDPPVHPRTLGCFLEYVGVELPIRKMLTCELADIAIEIRKSILRADKNWTDDVITLADRLEDVDRIVPKAFTDVPGHHCVQSSWANFRVFDLNWGEVLGNKIQAMRCPDVGVINGLQIPFSSLPEGGLEVMVGVEETCVDKLLREPLWNQYAVLRG